MRRRSIGLLAFMLMCASAEAQTVPWVVQSGIDGQPLGYEDPILTRRRDFGGPGAPLGYGASESYSIWPGAFAQSWSYGLAPTKFTLPNDGGQIITLNGTTAAFWATQDGSFDGMQYFLGPACGGQGWVLFDTSRLSQRWTSEVDNLAISKVSATDCQPLGPAFTRWQQGIVSLPTKVAGVRSNDKVSNAILTEHYDQETQDASQNMERNLFVYGMGNVYWQAWSTIAAPGDDLDVRCPQIKINGYYYPEGDWHLVNCRYYMNFVLAPPGFTEVMYGWPTGY